MKRIYKLTPVSQYDIAGMESWLQDMAARGLHLKKFRPLFCTFEKGPAAPMRYRVEPHRRAPDDDLPRQMLELYEDFGWDYADEVNRTQLIFRTADPNAPEPHTDPELQARGWRKMYRSDRNGFVVHVLSLFLLAGFLLYVLFGAGTPVYAAVTGPVLPLALLLLFGVGSLAPSYRDLSLLSALIRSLDAGVPMEHRAAYPRRRPWALPAFLAAVAIEVLLLVFWLVLPLTGGQMRRVADAEGFTPLSLEALEGADYEPYTMASDGFVDYANFARPEHSLLSTQWEVVQTGQWEEDGQWVRLEILWFDLPAPLSCLSRPLAQELLDRAMALDDDIWWTAETPAAWEVSYAPEAGFLAAARCETGGFQAAAAAAGDKAVLVRYTGHGDLTEHWAELAGMVLPPDP